MSKLDVQLAEKMAEFYDDPLGFVLFAFPWGEKGTPLEHFPDGPDEWHRDLFLAMVENIRINIKRRREATEGKLPDLKASRFAVASGHGIGKSACVAWLILYFMSCRPWVRGVVTANTADQLQTKTWPELAKWHQLCITKDWFTWTATRFYYNRCPENQRKNYVFDATPWSPERTEGFAGLHNAGKAVVLIFDEASGTPEEVLGVAQGAMTDGEAFFFAFGNPTRNQGWFYECFGKRKNYWWTRNVDSRSVRITNKEYLSELVDQYGEDSDYIKVRVRGQFPTTGDAQFVPPDIVTAAAERETPELDKGAPLVMGVDVARFGEDRTVLAFRRGQDARSIDFRVFRGLDTMQVAAEVAEAVSIWEPDYIFVDGVGVGAGVVDRLRQLGFRVIDVNGGGRADKPQEFANKRVEMWSKMRAWLRDGGCIRHRMELMEDLTAPSYSFTNSQQVKLERKEDMKKRGVDSPDLADALALTFAGRVRMKMNGKMRPPPQRAAGTDYDLFDH